MSAARRPGSVDGLWRVLAPSLCIWAVAAVVIASPGAGVWLSVASVLLVLLMGAVVYVRGRRRSRAGHQTDSALGTRVFRTRVLGALLIGAAALLLLGARLIVLEEERGHPGLSASAGSGRAMTVEVRLGAYPGSRTSEEGTRSWLRGTVDAAPVLVWLDGAPEPGWGPGSRVRVTGGIRAQPPESGAAFEISARGAVESIQGSLDGVVGALAESRARLAVAAAGVPGAELVPGFAVGDTSSVPERLGDSMRATSLTHLTAVSGKDVTLSIAAQKTRLSRKDPGC